MRRPSELHPGDRFQSYRVVREIARGGFGVVFELLHGRSGRRAALKVLTLAGMKPDVLKRFVNEARAANMVRHPGIVDVVDQGHFEDGVPWLLMEYVEGETLEERIKAVHEGTAPIGHDPLAILYQVAHALKALHQRGIVHRDLKPANIKLMPDPSRPEGELAKLLDFGIAKFVSDSILTLSEEGPVVAQTRADIVMGTPSYMAPEQCISAASVSAAADVYALGVIGYELLSGRRPFPMDWPQVGHVKLTQDAPMLAAPGLADDLVLLIMAMLRRSVTERPSMEQVVETLGRLGGRAVSGAQVRSLERKVRAHEAQFRKYWVAGSLLLACAVSVGVVAFSTRQEVNTPVRRELFVDLAAQPLGSLQDMDEATGSAAVVAAIDAESHSELEVIRDLAVNVPKQDLSSVPLDMSSSAPVLPSRQSCGAERPSSDCFLGDGLTAMQKGALAAAAKNAGLQLCRGQSVILEPSPRGFLECSRRPLSVSASQCGSFVLAADALWRVGWPTPKRVEVTCRR